MYPILHEDKVIGSARVERKGLYCHFTCVCRPAAPGRYHVYAKAGEWKLDLGLCVPEQGNFVLRTSIPAKKIPHGEMMFMLTECVEPISMVPLLPHQPFPQLMELKTARLVNQNGQQYISLSVAANRQDSGQSQEYHDK